MLAPQAEDVNRLAFLITPVLSWMSCQCQCTCKLPLAPCTDVHLATLSYIRAYPRRLLYWRDGEGSAAIEPIANALLSLHGRRTDRWAATVATLRQAVVQEPGVSEQLASVAGCDVQRVTFSDEPGRMFLLTRWAGLCKPKRRRCRPWTGRQTRLRGGLTLTPLRAQDLPARGH